MRLASFLCAIAAHAATINLQAQINVDKAANFTKGRDALSELVANATRDGLDRDAIRFVQAALGQYEKLVAAKEQLAKGPQQSSVTAFATGMFKVKELPKLKAKKPNMEEKKAEDLGKDARRPYIIPSYMQKPEIRPEWPELQKHWTLDRLMNDKKLQKSVKLTYRDPDKTYQMGQPLDQVTIKRYAHLCFFSDKKQRLPGSQTEHCERTVRASKLALKESELKGLQLIPSGLTDVTSDLAAWAKNSSKLIKPVLQDNGAPTGAEDWADDLKRLTDLRQFVFGPSGSGKNVDTQGSLYYDILIHGERRWLIGKTKDLQEVAEKAAQAGGVAFDRSSAYMFFEDKLAELAEEAGFEKFVEVNQMPGDIIVVPQGYSSISLALQDAISFREVVADSAQPQLDAALWNPPFSYTYVFCLSGADLAAAIGNPTGVRQVEGMQTDVRQMVPEWMTTLAVCSVGRKHGIAPAFSSRWRNLSRVTLNDMRRVTPWRSSPS
jgi:hypothetical protein